MFVNVFLFLDRFVSLAGPGAGPGLYKRGVFREKSVPRTPSVLESVSEGCSDHASGIVTGQQPKKFRFQVSQSFCFREA